MTKNQNFYHFIEHSEFADGVLFHPILMHFAARFCGKTYSEFASDYKVLVESNLKCLEYFDHDALGVISDPFRETSAFGAAISFPKDSVPICTEKIIQTVDDIRNLQIPDVRKKERTLDRINGVRYYKQLLGDEIPIIGWVEGPLAEACDLAGVTEILTKLALEPDFVKLLMEKCLRTAKDFAQAQIEEGSNVMGIGDAICSQISPLMYEDFILPLHQELFDFIHSCGAVVKLHICGNITHLLPNLKESGADIIDIDSMVDCVTAHEKLGNNIAVCGNLNPVTVIQDKTSAEVFTLSRELIQSETKRKFILSGGCEITANTPVENLAAMKKAAAL